MKVVHEYCIYDVKYIFELRRNDVFVLYPMNLKFKLPKKYSGLVVSETHIIIPYHQTIRKHYDNQYSMIEYMEGSCVDFITHKIEKRK